MSAQPQRRRNGVPAYYLGRPASLWLSITSLARYENRTADR